MPDNVPASSWNALAIDSWMPEPMRAKRTTGPLTTRR